MKLILPGLFLTLIALPAQAQQALVNSAAIEPPVMLEKIDTPKPKADRRIFWAGVSLLAASKTADAITTRRVLDDGGWENNPAFGRNPTAARQAGLNTAYFAAAVSAFYLTEHSRSRAVRWGGRAFIGLVVANHIKLAAGNSSILGTHGRTARPILPI